MWLMLRWLLLSVVTGKWSYAASWMLKRCFLRTVWPVAEQETADVHNLLQSMTVPQT
jgi:hypothetical protein